MTSIGRAATAGSAPPAASQRRRDLTTALLLVTVVLATRLPLLGLGFGSDDDSYRNVVAAIHSAAIHRYAPSRVPGFPLFDLLVFTLLPFGAGAINLAAAAAQGIAVVLAWRIADRLGIAVPWLPALALALAPGLCISATQAMDYAFGIAAVLGAYWAVLRGWPLLGGALVAVAAGFRPTHALFVIPAIVLLALRGRRRDLPAFALTAALGGALVFGPVLMSPEMRGLRHEFARHVVRDHVRLGELASLLRQNFAYLFGKLGTVVATIAIGWTLVRSRSRPARVWEAGPVAAESIAVAVYLVFYLAIPFESAYLLPALPFALLLIARLVSPGWLAAIALATSSEAVVLPSVAEHRMLPGRVAIEAATRRAQLDQTARLRAAARIPGRILLVGRFNVLRLVVLAPELERTDEAWTPFWGDGVALWRPGRNSGFAAMLAPPTQRALSAAGYRIVGLEP